MEKEKCILKKYLKENGLRHDFFARRVGVTAPALHTYVSKGILPPSRVLCAIEDETKGKVSIRDMVREHHERNPNYNRKKTKKEKKEVDSV